MDRPWQERKRPARLERRYEFPDYATLRAFLDRAADLSEEQGLYPDLGFGRDYVNVTIHALEGEDAVSEPQRRFAEMLDRLLAAPTTDN
jgi:pterin-4a-carbinolamine dehydratase